VRWATSLHRSEEQDPDRVWLLVAWHGPSADLMTLTIRLLDKKIERSMMAKSRPRQLKDALVEAEYTGEAPGAANNQHFHRLMRARIV